MIFFVTTTKIDVRRRTTAELRWAELYSPQFNPHEDEDELRRLWIVMGAVNPPADMRTAVELRWGKSCWPAPPSRLSPRSLYQDELYTGHFLKIQPSEEQFTELFHRIEKLIPNVILALKLIPNVILALSCSGWIVYYAIGFTVTLVTNTHPCCGEASGKKRHRFSQEYNMPACDLFSIHWFLTISKCSQFIVIASTFVYLYKSPSWSVQCFPVLRRHCLLHRARLVSAVKHFMC